MKRLELFILAGVFFMLNACSKEPDRPPQSVTCGPECYEESIKDDIREILEESLVGVPIDSATGSWQIIAYQSQVDMSKEGCEFPDCYIEDESTCGQKIKFETIELKDASAIDETGFDPVNDIPIRSAELYGESGDEDIKIRVEFFHQCHETEVSANFSQICQIWEATIQVTELTKSDSLCTAMVAVGDDPFGKGENNNITYPTDNEYDSIEVLFDDCQKQEAPLGQEIACVFSGEVIFKSGALDYKEEKTDDMQIYLEWLADYQDYTMYINMQGESQKVE